ncbi:stimulator of interferon genes protein isoform X2 [Oxyura jamaicensis]|uniref:stimulator of interferon genes protein isoform X2 n=1 Tax=Oxyura jamaicensis TaxID=8884 RepID=UPI0015A59C0F|nr:stimulator of interferon genes protein isoform X2 [Oxyura jamaicensis]
MLGLSRGVNSQMLQPVASPCAAQGRIPAGQGTSRMFSVGGLPRLHPLPAPAMAPFIFTSLLTGFSGTMWLCPGHRERAQALPAAAALEGSRKRCLSGLGTAHSARSARSPGSSRRRGRGRSDVSGTSAPEQPCCPAHPQAQGRASAARGVRPPGHLHRGAVPGWGAPVRCCPPPRRPPGSPADWGPAQGLLLPGRGDLPPAVQVSHLGASAEIRPQSTAGKSAPCFCPHECPHSCSPSSSLLPTSCLPLLLLPFPVPLWTYQWSLAGVPFPWGRNHSPSLPPPSASGAHEDFGDHLPVVSRPTLLPSRPTSAAGDPRSLLTRGCRVLCCSRRPGGEVGAPLAGHPTSGCQPTSRLPLPPRYHGSFWRALNACFPPRWHLALLLIGGSAYLDLQQGDRLSPYLALTCLCHLLTLALGLQKPSAAEISEMTERSKQNVAHGLAWSYYVGYLKIILPRIKESMEEISRANPNVQACRETWKLHILIPLNCNIWDDLEKVDSNIQYLTDLTETTLTRGGIKKRVYKHSLYAIRDGDNQDDCAAFSRDDRLEQAKLFYRTLEEILRGAKECTGTYRLIAYEEPSEAEPHFLSREILWHLRQQQQEEFTVYEGSPPRTLATALGSTDLSLQISASDLPQPLRSDHP